LKKFLLVLLLIVLVVITVIVMRQHDQKTTTTKLARGPVAQTINQPIQPPVALAIKQPIQAYVELGTEDVMKTASILWVQAEDGRKAKFLEPIDEMVSIDTPQEEDTNRGVATTINLPNEQARAYLICIKGKIGKSGQLYRVYKDKDGKTWQDKENAGPEITFRKTGNQGLAYIKVEINPSKSGLEAVKLTQITESSSKRGGGKK